MAAPASPPSIEDWDNVKWFIPEGWSFLGEPPYEPEDQIPVPVGEVCPRCTKPIEAADQGFVIPHIAADLTVSECAWHQRCMLREVLGDEADQLLP